NTGGDTKQDEVIALLARKNDIIMRSLRKDNNVYMDSEKVGGMLDEKDAVNAAIRFYRRLKEFKLYESDMNEIPLPEDVKILDIFVGSIAKERQTEAIPGRNGVVDYGTNYTERSVDLSMWIISSDTIDYRLLRNELYALFDTGNLFYISETNVPSRVLKVAVDEPYIPERITHRHASVDVTCRTLDSVFWESIYTTMELHDSGYSAIAEKYGLVDNIDDEKVQYRFTESNFTVYNAGNVTF